MKSLPVSAPGLPEGTTRPFWLDCLARRVVRARLEELTDGQLVVVEDGRRALYGGIAGKPALCVELHITDARFYGDVAFGGAVGAAEAYIRGYWSCSDLTTLVRILLRNRTTLTNMDSGLARLAAPLRRLIHAFNRNTKAGSRRNIAAHYDLGNDFYRLWLDERMMYSSAYFASPSMSLDAASIEKLDRICRKLELGADDHVIEIGGGWGSLAIHAASRYGCRVTTTTISDSQYEYARRAIEAAGVGDRVRLLKEDYRELEGQYDKLVSIEMIEAVGHQYHPTFFRKCCKLLKRDGRMLLQAITIADDYYEQARDSVDFIKRYIFPGGCLPSVPVMAATVGRVTDFRIIDLEDIGPHYATTLRHWHDRFMGSLDQVRKLGYSEPFIRMWQYYLCYCQGGFIERALCDVQLLLMRPDARPRP